MLRNRSLGLCLVLFCGALAAPVRADAGDERRPPDEARHWYGWQTLAVDGTALAAWFLINPIARDPGAPAMQAVNITGLGLYVLGAPIVHALHGNLGAAAGSFGLRVLPFGAAGLFISSCEWSFGGGSGCDAGFGLLTLIAFVLPLALDPALFAYEVERDRHTAYVAPWLDPTGGGLILQRSF